VNEGITKTELLELLDVYRIQHYALMQEAPIVPEGEPWPAPGSAFDRSIRHSMPDRIQCPKCFRLNVRKQDGWLRCYSGWRARECDWMRPVINETEGKR
jgi:hypothetical protein